jgi:hypothetical protein
VTRDDLASRLAARIADGVCWMSDDPVVIYEDATDGEARVTCTFPPGGVGLIFRLDEVGFPFLRQRASVGWLVLLCLPDGSMDAHLVECKRTVNWRKWHEIKGQMAASVTRCLALAGALRVEIRRFHGYTAHRNDRLSVPRSPDPVFTRLPLGPGAVAREEPAETREARVGQLDWDADEIRLEEVGAAVPHRRVPLDPLSGVGRLELITTPAPAR